MHFLFGFGKHDQGELSGRIVLRAEEISDPDGVERHLFPAQARQLNAIANGRTYMEQGLVPRAPNTR